MRDENVLAGCMVDGDPAIVLCCRRGRRRALLLAIAVEAALLTALLIVPLASPGVLPRRVILTPSQAPRRIRSGGDVEQALLVHRVEPRYPTPARQIRLEGTVQLHAMIGIDGAVHELEVESGHPLLAKAALDAVWQWRYRPTRLNGEPVEVETTITVIFELGP